MAFDGFVEKDFDTYKPAHRMSATFTLQRMKVKDKLRALAAALGQALPDALSGMEVQFSSEAPGLENNRNVAEQGAWWIRGAGHAEALKALVEKMSLRSATALDVSSWHKHASLGVVVSDEGVCACMHFHPRGAVDRRNLAAKLAESWAQDAFLALLKGLPEGWRVQLPGMDAPVSPSELALEHVTAAQKALEGDGPLSLVRPLGRVVDATALESSLVEAMAAMAPVYRFGAWTPEHDHIQAVKAAKVQREEARKVTALQPGDKVRILAGSWAGKTGVVSAVDKKGGLKVQVGMVSVRLDARDATPG